MEDLRLEHQTSKRRKTQPEADEPLLLLSPQQQVPGNLTPHIDCKMMPDPVKYNMYQAAIVSAIGALTQAGTTISAIGVVSAGFGGLVQSVLDAMLETAVQCDVLAFDKKPVALVELRRRKCTQSDWKLVDVLDMDICDTGLVDVFHGQVDILVSELLGGFGDNELAPECLMACHRLLKPTGVVIPRSTTSFLAPVNARTLRRFMLNSRSMLQDCERWWVHEQHHSKATDVVLLAQPMSVFSFVYPHKGGTLYRRRCLTFTSICKELQPERNSIGKRENWCHGFMGYFEAQLHGEIMFSTLPGTATPQLNGWNPVFFPVQSTFCLPARLNMRRASSAKGDRVWYSWGVVSGEAPEVEHNVNGRLCYMSSSRQEDCRLDPSISCLQEHTSVKRPPAPDAGQKQ
jgi:protein arginine N-methyltransferase 5